MTRSTSFYLPDDIRNALDERRGDRTRSQVFNTLVQRYVEVCREHVPILDEEDWDFVRRAFRNDDPPPGGVLKYWVIRKLKIFSEKFGGPEEHEDVIQMIEGLSYAQVVALVDAVERYWAEG